jgi:hypothetical protein
MFNPAIWSFLIRGTPLLVTSVFMSVMGGLFMRLGEVV